MSVNKALVDEFKAYFGEDKCMACKADIEKELIYLAKAYKGNDPEKMDHTLEVMENHSLYSILDAHHYWGYSGWQLLPTYKDDWINTWVEIATRYANRSSIAGYIIIDEPYILIRKQFGLFRFPKHSSIN